MISDPERAIQLTTAALLRDFDGEVDIIFRFGSMTKGTTHRYSDLDIAFVPAQDDRWYSITVLVEDRLLDLFALHWPRLERWAEFDDMRGTVILEGEVIYARDDAAAARWQGLVDRMTELLQPAARPDMLAKALAVFESAGYPFYLLQEQAAAGNQMASLYHARALRDIVTHSVAVANQAAIDTRKLDKVLALPRLPAAFADHLDRISVTTDPLELLASALALMQTTRAWLLTEQRKVLARPANFASTFDSAYPELKADLQKIMLAAEQGKASGMGMMSFYHELMIHMAWATTGVSYGSFNSLADYEQDLEALGFPALLPFVEAGDYVGLRAACDRFDARLRTYLTEGGAALNEFASLQDLEAWLAARGG